MHIDDERDQLGGFVLNDERALVIAREEADRISRSNDQAIRGVRRRFGVDAFPCQRRGCGRASFSTTRIG